MDISIKYKIVEKIIQSQDENLLNEIKSLLELSETDFWNDLPFEVQQGINKAKNQLNHKEGIPHSNVMEEIKHKFLGK
ncbi:hypothetical protein [Pedobacter cryophilus]|uniref:Addiction module protein n=1 Tax=Pedobacter cryophilus TaxID=2571271 RepID=A0A4U1C123_9SPHI|nr:hypothetical protein [Pedobacter cryophilus]TKB98735.1 hypothetical protein FA046_06355 [Pedobacter cryophilus]